ncbi:hypothetical protein COW36_11655 [bacterium (Candidatus Blackallbacteria) CG17_big_fil_post_rev_8_21_14_2_50_48_46]|uniref:Uncharacterized protein n=1 Tax=bacterium (Candidatus Blackallbacteria) CG17_big_fil_post_rev_8_21_14_2_50_48_46 TaxID=2014261 RepID=A0A2M7G4C7_9BACT|nr:MAG: hypothetical protein COW64_07090 [bacterium (Candidatus Blackallbacteria) CG18_big_fil_WC_8_21_14_2_50_49_26]PIW16749.1 MAG: hypothetical protein COW36_11655 [bacterium (Candidatus Blackallbacteria) CG17_big_fil_post_rev_8_21_14_2_50_48_46]PIW51174.1 MAG: hypothetical protein COW20_00075 [bacterium (Candidatus Blackallbacteria) CG13_big_fil_rev_8_21_14_2_50_49_14]
MSSHLEVLKNIFLELDQEAILEPPNENTPYEQLCIHLYNEDTDHEDTEPLLAVLVLLNEMISIEKSANEDQLDILQISVVVSLGLSEENKYQISYLLHKINKNIPLGYFCITDDDDIFFKYSLLSQMSDSDKPQNYFDPVLIIDCLGFISEAIFGIRSVLVNHLQGKIQMNEVLGFIE